MILTTHFKDRTLARLPKELTHYNPIQLAVRFSEAIEEVTLASGDTYRVIQLDGIEYGLGYKLSSTEEVIITTFIAPYQVMMRHNPTFKCTIKELNKC